MSADVRNFVARVRNFAALVRNFAADSRLVRRWKCGELTAAQRAICHAALDFVRFVLFGAGPLVPSASLGHPRAQPS